MRLTELLEGSNFRPPLSLNDIPDWVKYLAPDSMLTAKDVSQLFDISTKLLSTRMARGQFPLPDKTIPRPGSRTSLNLWKVSTIKKAYSTYVK